MSSLHCPMLLAVVLAAPIAVAQTDLWTHQAPLPSAGAILGVHALSPGDIWCSSVPPLWSTNGHVAHTPDGGAHWQVSELDAGGVSAIFFVDPLYGWTAGGAFRHTTDGGQTWITDNQWGSIADLFFLDRQRGWACGNGGVAYWTSDGGASWTAVVTPAGDNLSSIWFVDSLTGWAAAIGGRIVHTIDGGLSWTIAHDSGAYLATIQFLSPLEGWAIGGDTFLHTVDGGTSWSSATVPAGTWSQAARFFDSLNGVAVGGSGHIVRTSDGGTTWTTVRPAGSGPGLLDVEYGGPQAIVCSGDAGALLRSLDGGTTWATLQSGARGTTHSLHAFDARIAWATNQGGEVARTGNGGAHWERVQVPGIGGLGPMNDIEFVDALRGWVVGSDGTDGHVARSIDGGQSWQHQHTEPNFLPEGVVAFDSQTVVVFGPQAGIGSALRTTNGGQGWLPAGPAQGSFRGGDAVDSSTGWIVGTHIYKTTDAGSSWTLQYGSSGPLLASVSFADAQHGWASGYGNQVLRTIDGGATWVPQASGAPSGTGLMGIHAVDADTAWVVGWGGFAARTIDGGASWQREVLPGATNADFECVAFVNAEDGWVGGAQGIDHRDAGAGCTNASNYCESSINSTGQEALIAFDGSCAVADEDFTLTAGPLPPQPVLFFYGPQQLSLHLGNGTRCVGGALVRLHPPLYPVAGFASRHVDLAAQGLATGMTRYFQAWYRDPAAGGAFFNLSDGLSVTFE